MSNTNTIREKYNNFVMAGSGNSSSSESTKEVINIVKDFSWHYTNPNNKDYMFGSSKTSVLDNVSYAYVSEYRQIVTSQLANILNILKNIVTASTIVGENISLSDTISQINLGDSYEKYKEKLLGFVNTASSFISNSTSGSAIHEKLQSTNIMTDYLKPYDLSYFIQDTNYRYKFPSLVDTSFANLKNSYGDANGFSGGRGGLNIVQNAINAADKFTGQLRDFAIMYSNITDAFNHKSGMRLSNTEMAKEYNFPTETESVKISFPLYNTISPNDWKKNYIFLLYFIIKNMPWKDDYQTFIPPLLYRVVVPGQKLIPLGYVEDLNITTLGMKRNLTFSFDKNTSYGLSTLVSNSSTKVSVPEAWNVSITFKSLISNVANSYIELFKDNITTEITK